MAKDEFFCGCKLGVLRNDFEIGWKILIYLKQKFGGKIVLLKKLPIGFILLCKIGKDIVIKKIHSLLPFTAHTLTEKKK